MLVVAKRLGHLALEEVQDGGHRGGVFRKLFILGEAEDFEPGPKRGTHSAGSSFSAPSSPLALSAENAKWPRTQAG